MYGLIEPLDRFIEAATVAQKWRRLAKLEKSMTAEIGRIFKAQGKAAVKALADYRGRFTEALTQDDGGEIVSAASATTRARLYELLQDTSVTALGYGWADAGRSAGVDIEFNRQNPYAQAYLLEHGYGLISQIDETTRGNIATIIDNGKAEGWSYDKMAREISSLYNYMAVGKPQQHIDSRAHLIVVTELGNAYEAGSSAIIQTLVDDGANMEKRWLTVGDNRVSAGCRDNAAEGWIPYSQAFSSGHQHPLRFPGCRCTTQYQRAK